MPIREANTASFFVRSIIQLVVYLPFQWHAHDAILGYNGERWMLFIRSLFGFVAFVFFYIALRFISLSDASTIVFSSPVYVSIFACILINEPCGAFQIATVMLTVLGVVLISKPSFLFGDADIITVSTSDKIIGVVLSFISSLAMALTFICMRRLQKTSTAVVINHFSVVCILLAIPSLFVLQWTLDMEITIPSASSDYLYMLLNGVCGVCGQFFLTFALKVLSTSTPLTASLILSLIAVVNCRVD